MIQTLSRAQIDIHKWDKVISEAYNTEIYALSWFLDVVSPNWKAVILNDYEAVMPLPVKSKFGFSYIVQPPFCQKLGVFSANQLLLSQLQLFDMQIAQKLSVRYSSCIHFFSNQSRVTQLPNYVLSIDKPYLDICSQYNSNTKRNLKKAKSSDVVLKEVSQEVFLKFFISSFSFEVANNYLKLIEPLLLQGIQLGIVRIIGAFVNDELCGATAFYICNKKIYYLYTFGNEVSKQKGAMFLIIDSVIQEYAEKGYVIDFEGSAIEGVAHFYKGFGAVLQPYFYYSKTVTKFI